MSTTPPNLPPADSNNAERGPAPEKRSLLIEQLEERILFDAVPVGPVDLQPESGFDASAFVQIANQVEQPVADGASDGEQQSAREVLFVDKGVEGYQDIVAGFVQGRDIDVFLINPGSSGLEQIANHLDGRTDLTAIHIVSHGDDARLRLGNSNIGTAELSANYSAALARIGNALSDSGDLLIYGCQLAESAEGEAFVRSLSELTGADVAASDDLTGHESLGGDWNLEYSTGKIEASVQMSKQAQLAWRHVLVEFVPGALVGVDISPASDGNQPVNFNHATGAGTFSNLIDENGATTGISLQISSPSALFGFTGTFGDADPSTIPTFTNDLSGLDEGFYDTNTDQINLVFRGLNAGEEYALYTFGNIFVNNLQNIEYVGGNGTTNAGGSIIAAYDLAINGIVGSTTAALEEYAVIMTADASGEIRINITSNYTAFITGAAISTAAGVAPEATPDVAFVIEDTAPNPVTGNVLANDTTTNGPLTVNSVNGAAGNVGAVLTANYGTMQINADGSYTYTLDDSDPAVQALNDQDNIVYIGTDSNTIEALNLNTGAQSVVTTSALAAIVNGLSGNADNNVAYYGDDTNIYVFDPVAGTHAVLTSLAAVGIPVTEGLASGGAAYINGSIYIGTEAPGGGDAINFYRIDLAANGLSALPGNATVIDIIGAAAAAGAPAIGGFGDMIVSDGVLFGSTSGAGFWSYDLTTLEFVHINSEYRGQLASTEDGRVFSVNGSDVQQIDLATGKLTGSIINATFTAADASSPISAPQNPSSVLTETFTYTIVDADGDETTTTITVTIGGSNDAPIATDHSITVLQDSTDNSAGATTLPTDTDNVDSELTVTINSVPAAGQGEFTIGAGGAAVGAGTVLTPAQLAALVFTPASSYSGPVADLAYTVTDPRGLSDTAVISVTINGAPTATNNSGTVVEDTQLTETGNVVTDDDGDGQDSDPESESLTVVEVNGSTSSVGIDLNGIYGTVRVNSDGSYTYTLDNNNSTVNGLDTGESLTETFTYAIQDPNDQQSSATLTITIEGSNDAPVYSGTPISDQVHEDDETISSVDVTGAFSDPEGDTLTYTVSNLPAGLSISSSGMITGTIDNSASQGGTSGVYSITVTATDDQLETTSTTFTWTVTNPGPTAFADANTTLQSTTASGNVIGNDNDPDGDTITVLAVNGQNGDVGATVNGDQGGDFTINSDGSYSFDPAGDFDYLAFGETESTVVSYTITDSEGGTSTATLTVVITGENDAPQNNGSIPPQDDVDSEDITLDVSGYFTDADTSNSLSFSATGLPNGLSIDADGLITGTLTSSASQSGPFSVTVTVSDGTVISQQTFAWTVTNPAPDAFNDFGATDQDSPTSGDVVDNDSDPDGDTITVTEVGNHLGSGPGAVGNAIAGAGGGLFTLFTDGGYDFDPNGEFDSLSAGESATTWVTYEITDADGATHSATLEVTVTGTNEDPTVVAIPDQVNEDIDPISGLDVSGYFLDGDANDTLLFSASGLPAGLVMDTAGVISGTIAGDASVGGPYTVTVTADDQNSGTVQQTFEWTVTNPLPVAEIDYDTSAQTGTAAGNVLTNDADPDFDTINVLSVNGNQAYVGVEIDGSAGGRFTINADGSYDFSTDGDFNYLADGETVVTYVTYNMTDNQGGQSGAELRITITGSNDDPVVDSAIPDQDNLDSETVSLPVSSFFSDPDTSDSLEFSATGLPPGLVMDPDGNITGTIDSSASQAGNYSVTVTADDGNGGTTTALFNWTVTNVRPNAADDFNATDEETAVGGDVIANDSDPDGDTITVTGVGGVTSTSPANVGVPYTGSNGGVFVVNPNGSYSFDPDGDFEGLADGEIDQTFITYTITDADGGTRSASLVITITGTNDGPTATNNTGSVTDGTQPSDSGNLISDNDGAGVDSDPDGDTLTVKEFAGSAANVDAPFTTTYGTIQVNTDGSYTYTVDANNTDVEELDSGEFLTETFSYTVTDSEGGDSSAVLTVTINGTNDAPIVSGAIPPQANEDSQTIATVDVTSAFSDIDGDNLQFSATGLPAGLSIDANGLITGTIDHSESVTGTFAVTVTASDGDESVSTVFTWTVTNPGPDAVDDTGATTENALTAGTVFTNDSDPDGDTIVVNAVNTAGSDVGQTVAGSDGGTFIVNSDGSYDFDPSGDFDDLAENETTTTSVTYTITDNEGGTDTATLTLTITGTNDDPVANGQIPDQTSVDDETIATLNVSSFFDDADTSDTLTFTATGLPDGLSIDAAGNITGTIDNSESVTGTFSVTVIADDGNGGTVEQIFEWAVANPGPVAGNDTDSTTENASVSGSLFGNDSDPDGDTINVVSVEGDTNFDGNAIDGSDGGKFTINANGSYSFDPDADFEYLGENETATTSVSYRISDGEGGFATATLEITVTGTNDDPTSNGQIPDQTSVDAETIATLNVSSFFDDADTSDTLTFTATGLPAGLVMDTAGNITGTIDNSASVTGSFSVTVTADDGHGGTVARTFIWSVANPGPTATGNTAEVTEGSSLTDSGNLVTDDDGFGSDSDPDADTLTVLETGSTTLIYGTVVNADGGYTYTLDNNNATVDGLDEGETLTDTFAYTVTDSEGGQSIANLTITINGENDAPVAGGTIPPQAGFDSDTVATVDASLAFSDPDGDTLTYSAGNLPDGLSIDENTGLITGTPGSSASTGAAGGVYTVTVTATDDNNAAVSTTFDWTVTNPAPTAGDDTFTTDEDTAISGIVTANDADPDGDDLTFALDTSAANGNVSLGSDGSFTYTPDPDFHGTDSFTYTLTDADGAEVTATVDITVDPVNDSPAVDNPLDDQASVDSETISLDISGSFSDVDGDDPAFSATGLPPGLTIDTNGNITGTITSSASVGGTYSVEVTVDDGNGGVTIETFDWTVTNPAPVAGDDSYTTSEDTMVSGTVVTNDSDVDGDAMTYMVTGGPSNGQVTLNSDGTFDYTPDPDFTGTDSFDYELTDADGATTTATVTITVDPVNDAPVADSPFPDQSNLDSDDISISIAGNFNDVEGDSLEFSATGLPPGLVMDPDGNITGTIDSSASQAGNYSVTVTADDGNGGTTTALFNWTVTNVRPNAADDFNATDEETAVGGDVIANDSDPDGDTITVTGVGGVTSTSPANVGVPYTGSNGGVFVVNPNGSYSFDPDGDFEGLADGEIDQTFITYTITDADGGTRSASLVITITGTNDGPTATNNTGSVTDGTQPSDSGNLISDNDGAGVDSDPDGDTLTVKEFAGSAANVDAPFTTTYGTIQVNTDGSYTYTVDANNTDVEELDSGEFLTETFSYTVTDSEGGDSSAVLTVTINGTNDAPIVSGAIPPQANEDSQTIATVDVTSAFSDIDGDNLQFSATGLPAGLSIDANGLITGTIDHSESVTGTFAVTVTASDGDESVSTVFTWTVTNPGPDAVDDTGATTENALTAGTVFTNDSDPDGDTIVVNAVNTAGSDVGQTVAGSDGGTFIVNSDGSYDFDPSGDFDDLAENETTTTSVTYTITDNEGGTDTATLTLTITGTNDDPVANGQIPDQTSVDDETIATLNVSSFFDDADTSDTLTFTATGLPDGLSIDAAGNITGTIDNSESVTGTFSVTVIADDGNGGTVEQIFEWAVANPGPVAGNDTDSTTENASVSGSLFGNDSDPDGDTINVVSVEGDTNFDGNAIDGSDGGKFTINANGSYSFDPDADFEYLGENETATTSVSYRISDGEGGFATATLEITVTGTNDDPTSNGQIPDQTSVDAETIATLNVSSFFDDADTSDTLTFTATGLPAGLVMDTAGNITGTIDHSESVTGTFAVTVTASDGDESVSTVFTWTVTNPGPDAVDDTGATTENALTAGTVFTNDSDPDGDTIVVNAVNTAGSDVGQTVAGSDGGTFIVNSDGSYDFDPSGDFDDLAENETTTTSVTYTITDNEGGTDTATLTLTITGTNDDPVANGQIPDQTSVDDETIATLNVSSFFDDADTSDTLTFTATGLPDGLSIDAAGNITGTIDNSESVTGTFSVTVIADDGNGGTVEQIFEWAVANPGPVAGNDTDSTTENASVSGSLFGNDSDPDGDTINVVSVEGDTNFDGNAIDGSDGGKFTINANGSYSFDPDADFEYLGENETATTSVSYRISDGEGGFATATLEITVTGTNDDPTSNGQIPDQTSVDAETIATLNVSSFFDDADTSDTLTFTATGLPAGLVMDTAGNITGTIDHSESVTGTFAVTVTASDGDESVSTVFTWTVTNPGPDAVDDTGATTENALTAGTVFTNDSDPDGDTIVVNAVNTAGSDVGQTVAGSDGGTFIVNSDGSYDFDPSGDFDDLAENETTTTSVTYTITDNEGGTDTATLTLTITGTNDDPVANGQIPDQTSVDDETIATLNVSSFFDDADTSDTLTFTATGLPDGLSIDAAGNITGTIDNSESVTGTFSVTVIADDGNGGTVEQIFEWAVANPGPVAGNDTDSTTENASVSGSLFGNDSDPDGDTINVVSVEGDTNFDGNAIDGSDGGKFTINANGSYSFDPDADFEYLGENETATTSVSYRISDGEGGFATATLEITVTGTNDDPTSNGQIPDQTSVDAETIATLNVSSFFDDADTSDTLTFTATGLPAGLVMDTAGNITGTIDHSESVTGTFAVTVTASDGDESVSTVFTWTVTNPGPDAVDDTGATTENALTAGTVFTNDSDPDGDTIVVNAVNTAGSDVGQTVAGSDGGTFIVNSDGSYDFDPSGDFDDLAENETTTTSVTYTITDNEGGTDTATLTLTITGTNDDPVANGQIPDQTSVDDETIATLNVSSFFDDADTSDTLTFTATGLPDGLSIDAAGNITGTIDNSESVTGTFSVTVIADDGNGGTVEQIFEWAVANPGPVAGNDTDSTTENASVSGSLFGNDSDPDGDTINVVSVEGDTNFDGNAIDGSDGGKFTINANGSYSFDPDADFEYLGENETATTSVSYRISDGEGGFATATLEITVTGTNDDPTSNGQIPDQTSVDAETIATLNVSSFFDDADTSDTLTFTATGLPAGLVMDTAGNITGTIDHSESVTGTFAVTVTASDGDESVSTVFTWTVTNPGPDAVDDTGATTENALTAGTVFTNDSDPDGDTIVVNAVNTAGSDVGQTVAGSDGGTFIVNSDGSYDFDPSGDFDDLAENETTTTSVTYTITDNEGGTDTATLTLTITGTNDDPVANGQIPDQTSVDDETIATLNVSSFFDDADTSDTLTFTATGLPDGLSIDAAGNITGTIDNSESVTGTFSVTVIADDGNGGTVEQIFEWAVANPGPVAGNDTDSTTENASVSGSLFGNDSDPDGDTINVVSVEGDTNFDGNAIDGSDGGKFTINANGSYSFDPDADFEYLGENETATTSVSYRISDGEGGFATATLEITVTGTNDDPTSNGQIPDQTSVDAETIATLNVSSFFDDADTSDTLTFTATGLPAGLVMDTAGNITGTIDNSASVTGSFSVTVTADDGHGGTVARTFIWSVANPGPTATGNTAEVTEGSSLTDSGNLVTDDDGFGSDSDPDADTLTVLETGSTTLIYGTIVVNADGGYTYTLDNNNATVDGLDEGETLTDTFAYTVTDSEGGQSIANLTITINGENDAPVAGGTIPPQAGFDSDTVATVDASLAFSDPDGDTLTYSAGNLPDGLSIDENTGLITGTPGSSASTGAAGGVYTVTVTATDDNNAAVSTTFDWTVTNPAPTAGDDTFTTDEDTAISGIVTANDADPDGDDLTFALDTSAANGNVSLGSDGSFTYTPDPDFHGTDSFTYTLTDADGAEVTATVDITVDPVNDSPAVDNPLDDQASVDSETISLDISGSFSDVDGDDPAFSATGLPPGLTIDTNGNITGTITSSASVGGTYSVEVTVDDGNGGVTIETFDWTVTNPAPVAGDDSYTTSEDTMVSGTVVTNDSDVDGDAMTYMVTGGPSNGQVTLNSDGTFDYTPDPDFTGTDSFDYELTDADGATTTATVTITVDPVNDAPVADSPFPDQSNLDSDDISISIAGNFNDVEGDSLEFSATGLPPGLVMDPDGNITGTIDSSASQAGNYSVTVTADDGNGGTTTALFNWTVTNPAPVAGDDNFNTDEDTAISGIVTANDSDPDGDSVTFEQLTFPLFGDVVFNGDGSFTYTPDDDFNGTDSFDYDIVDADGTRTTATVTINVAPVNDTPNVDSNIPNQSSQDSDGIILDIAPNFSDVEGDTLTFSATGLPPGLSMDTTGSITGTIDSSASAGGTYTVTVTADDGNDQVNTTFEWTVTNPAPDAVNDSFNTDEDTAVSGDASANDSDPDGDTITFTKLTDPANGSVNFLSDGTFTYTPDTNFSGIDSFGYEVIDADGSSTTATITIIVGDVNDPPAVTTPIPDQSSLDSELVSVDVSGNFGDVENDTLTFSATGLPPGLGIDPDTGVIFGTIDSSASAGGPYSVTVFANDGNATGSDTFEWTVDNVAPVAGDDNFTTDEDTAVSGTVTGNDSDPDNDILTFSDLTTPANGSVTLDPDGTFTYTPDLDFEGTDSFDYTVADADGATRTATVTIVVTPVNDAPVTGTALPEQFSLDSETGISVDIGGGFQDVDGDDLTYTADGLPAGLTLDPVTGLITGTINSSESSGGPYTVEIVATDPDGESATQQFTWNVDNPTPTAGDDSFTTNEDTVVSGDVTGNDTDPDGDPVDYAVTAEPMNGSVSMNPNGTFSYTPDPNFNGTESFEYTLTDADGATTTAVVTINVTPVNDPPVVTDSVADQSSIDSTDIVLDVSDAFDDIDSPALTYTATGLPAGLSIDPVTGIITGTIDPGASSGGPYPVVLTAQDPDGQTVTDTFTWNVDNLPPVAEDDTFTTDEDTPLSGSVAGNDSDPDGDAVSFSLLPGGPSHGILSFNPDGSFDYIPDADYTGPDQFDYTICDADGFCTTAVATINVTPVNDPPVVNNPVNDRSEFDSDDITLDVSTAFDDAEGDNLTFTATGLPPGLSIDNNTGIISGTIDPGASSGGPYTVEVVATDPSGESATDTFSWTVENIPPVAEDDSFATSEDTSVSGSVTGNDSDPDGDTATFTTLSGPANGTLDWNTDGTFTYTPDPDFNGTDSFVYEVADADGATATAVVTIDVAPVNDGPSATDGADTTDQDTPIDIDLTVNDFDPEGDTLTIVEINGQSVTHGEAITLPSGAVLTINGDGTIDYDPANAFDSLAVGESAIDRFEYTVDDGNGGTATAETVVTINGENDPPVASDDYVKITVDTPVTINVLTNDVDPEGEPLDVILLNNPNGGTATVNPNGTIAFVPDDGFEGTVDIHYLIEDPHGATSEATLTIEVEPEFRFDSFTNFADSFDTSHLNSGVNHQAAPGREILSQKIFTLAPEPIFSGHARPGTQIVGRIYDESGTLIGEASANTDPGGNWMMQFQGTEGNNFYRIEFEQVSAGAADVYGYFGLNPADNTYQAMESITTYEDPLSVEKAMQSSLDSIQQIHRVNENPLGFGLDKEN